MKKEQNKIIIDYDGDNIINHQMNLAEFATSISGCNDLLKIIASELGISEENIQINIGPLEPGSLKTTIIISLLAIGGFTLEYTATHFLDGMGAGSIIETLGKEFADFLKLKKDKMIISDNLPQQIIEASDIQGKLLQNNSAHEAVVNIVKCLNSEAETLTVELPNQHIYETFYRKNIPNLTSNPFEQHTEIAEETIEERTMTLFLENVGITGDKWTFYEKKPNNKKKQISASVLDGKLLNDARNSSLEKEYKNVPLICTVKIKTYKKAGAKRSSPAEFFIITCSKDEPLSLF